MTAPAVIPQRLRYSVAEVAQLAGCSAQHVRDEIARGTLRAERGVGNRFRVPAGELRRFIGEDAVPGHEVVSSAPDVEKRELLLRARRLIAELGVVMAELES